MQKPINIIFAVPYSFQNEWRMLMAESTGRKRKSADYNGSECSGSGNDLYNLRELDIKKEYLLKVVLPFAHSLEPKQVDVLVEDSVGSGYIRRLITEVLPSGSIGLYDITAKLKILVSEYSVSFNEEGKICGATEDMTRDGKHVSVVYEVDEIQDGYRNSFKANSSSVIVSFKQGGKEITKLYVASGVTGEDILEEIKFPNNFAQIMTLRHDE